MQVISFYYTRVTTSNIMTPTRNRAHISANEQRKCANNSIMCIYAKEANDEHVLRAGDGNILSHLNTVCIIYQIQIRVEITRVVINFRTPLNVINFKITPSSLCFDSKN